MRPGELIPDFELPDQDGKSRLLSSLVANGPVVLFFYPAAMTSGCTKEACHFRDLAAEFGEFGAQRVGISTDSVDKQWQFATQNGFDYPLLADTEGKVAKIFGVKRRFGPLPVKRRTFVIGTDSRLIEEIGSEFNMDIHADTALKVLAAQH